MLDKQTQKAGDNSQQLQVGNVIVNVGIDEKRAREIYEEMNLQVRKDYTEEALRLANHRIKEFENSLLPKMESVEGALEAFADPSFQLLLVEAQKTAASTERPADYDLLSELLIHRFIKGENRVTRAGISRAVEIVDKISDDALLGLTVFHSVATFTPISGNIYRGLDVLNDLFGKIIYGKLPTTIEWLDHLDILDAVRISSFGNLKRIEEYYTGTLVGYVEIGINKQSEDYSKAIELLDSVKLPHNILVDNVLNDEFVRIDVINKKQIHSLELQQHIVENSQIAIISTPLSELQINAMCSIYDLYNKDSSIKQQNIKIFMEEWDKRHNLKILRDWWDNITTNIQLTSVGRVLAHSNAQRCDRSLPPLN